VKTINLLNSIISIHDRDKAKATLRDGGLTADQAEIILQNTHCQPPENFFITSEDMVAKSGVWAHFGAWNLTKASMYMRVHDQTKDEGLMILKQDFGLDDSSAQQYFREISTMDANYWVAPWPSYAGGLSGCSLQGNLVQCGNGVIFNRETEDVLVKTQIGDMRLKQVAFIDNKGNFKVDTYDKDLIEANDGRWIGGAIIQNPANPNDYASILMDDVLVPSMFTRLFYFGGEGLAYFDQFYSNRDITGSDIIVWKIDWNGESANDIYAAVQTPSVPDRTNATNATNEDIDEAEDSQIDLFAKCIADSGAKMYGASWCSHCQNQKRTLGNSGYIPYTECDVGDTTKQECIDAGITAYPTWIIDGKQITGEKTIEQLSSLTGCELSQ
jgi:glutaredoxin